MILCLTVCSMREGTTLHMIFDISSVLLEPFYLQKKETWKQVVQQVYSSYEGVAGCGHCWLFYLREHFFLFVTSSNCSDRLCGCIVGNQGYCSVVKPPYYRNTSRVVHSIVKAPRPCSFRSLPVLRQQPFNLVFFSIPTNRRLQIGDPSRDIAPPHL